jgi:hypothetical protein
MPIVPLIQWTGPEHHYTPKTSEWYWAVAIIAFTASVLSFMFGNPIFGILIVVGTIALTLSAHHPPKEITIEINDRGVVINNTLYPFLHLESFWIDTDHEEPRLMIKSHKTFMPLISLIIRDIDDEDVRQVLLKYIAEVEHPETLGRKILERLGF